MGFLFGKRKTVDAKPEYTGLQVQSSSLGLPIPIVWGTNKIAGNMIWYGDFAAIRHEQSQGGKGGGGSVTTVNYTYSASFALALCEGQIGGIGRVWNGTKIFNTPADAGFGVLGGVTGQQWTYLLTAHPAEFLDYSYTALAVAANMDLGGSASLPNTNFEVQGILTGSMSDQGNSADADVGLLVQDFLTNARYGANFPAAFIDTATLTGGAGTSSLRAYTRSLLPNGFGLSPALSTQEQASSILDRWFTMMGVAPVWNGFVLKFVPYFPNNLSASSGGWTWAAPNTAAFSLTDDDFVKDGTNDPVRVSRNDTADAYNVVRFEILDRNNNYQTHIVEQRDEAHINWYGQRIAPTVQAHEITDPNVASMLAYLMLQRGLTVRNTYTFKLSWEYCTLDPMDLLLITDSGLQLVNQPVRIKSISEDDNCELTIEAEEYVSGVSAVAYPAQSNAPTVITTNVAPQNTYPPMIFEPPSGLVSTPQIWMALCGGVGGTLDPYWGGCQVWVSTDGTNYTLVGTQHGPSRMGTLTANLPTYSGAAPDATDTLAVDLTQSGSSLQTVSSTDAANGVTNCWVGDQTGEALSFTTATLTAQFKYNLTNLYRGQGATPVGAHATGDKFCRLDDQILKIDLPPEYVGLVLHVKVPAFNIWGNALQDLSTVTAYTYDPNGNGQTLADNPVWAALLAGQNVDCGTAGTTVTQSADAGTAGSTSIGTVNLGTTP